MGPTQPGTKTKVIRLAMVPESVMVRQNLAVRNTVRPILPVILALALAGSPSLAADDVATGRLAPGKPAGTREANLHTSTLLPLVGVAGFTAGLVLILMHAHGSVKGGTSASTTTTAG